MSTPIGPNDIARTVALSMLYHKVTPDQCVTTRSGWVKSWNVPGGNCAIQYKHPGTDQPLYVMWHRLSNEGLIDFTIEED